MCLLSLLCSRVNIPYTIYISHYTAFVSCSPGPALGTGVGLGVICSGRIMTGSRGLVEGGHMVRATKRCLDEADVPVEW